MSAPNAPALRLAIAVYLFGIGATFIVLSAQREPEEFGLLLRGVLVGAVLIHLAAPLVSYGSPQITRDAGLLVLSLAAAGVTLYPRALALPFLHAAQFVRAADVLGIVIALGLVVTIVELLRTTFRLTAALVTASDRSASLRTLLAAEIGLALAVPGFVMTERWMWTDPPFSLPVSLVGAAVLLGSVVAAMRWVLDQPWRTAKERRPSATPWIALFTLLVGVLVWVQSADGVFPSGFWPASVTVVADDPGDINAAQEYFRLAERRTGLRGSSERIIIRIGPNLVAAPFNSNAKMLPNGEIEISLNAGLPPDRVHNYLTVQSARMLSGMRLPAFDPALLDGYAYWASESSHSPFYAGIASGSSARAACAAAPAITFKDRRPFFYWADASLPFVRAELTGGVGAARDLLFELAETGEGPAALHARALADCSWFLARYPSPNELIVEAPPDRPYLATETLPLDAFEAAVTRTGLDAYGGQIIVRYAVPPGGARSYVDFSDPSKTVIIVQPNLTDLFRREALVFSFAVIFVSTHYGGVDPVIAGFADWAVSDHENPFMNVVNLERAQNVCRMRGQVDLTKLPTLGSLYLAALPFVQAEKEGGVRAAQELLRETMATPSTVPQVWRSRVDVACEEWLRLGQ